jgi:hypothetical protein
MNIQLKTVAAALAGVGIGIAAMHGLRGGQAKAPPAFVISNIEVTDPAGYRNMGRQRPQWSRLTTVNFWCVAGKRWYSMGALLSES